ncbi:DUF4960 domain-containing protein [Chryseobacterium indologenes]|uniref:DUF4960 domain-containing protein n=1 Tax=Chryseobacterium indologenes TaxID=253 RepID=UPI0010241BA3|nr:DUF4960 domain-containing protein [Chryseobacterium indologenes]VFA41381.1 Por secretion system C-terminal sorting domain [Chryseobacterium indologenes]
MRKLYLSLFAGLMFANVNAQMKKIAFIGQADVYNTNIPTANDGLTYDDDRAAAVWFMETFLPAHSSNITGSYFSFQDVAEGADLSGYDVVWVQSDGATYTERLNEWPRGTVEGNGDKHCLLREAGFQWNGQCGQLEDDFMWKIKQFYKSGKKLLLGNFAGKGLEVFGVFDGLNNPWEYRPNQSFGDTTANPANIAGAWGTNWSGNQTPILLTEITTNSVSCTNTSQSIEFLGTGTEKKNRALQYNLNWGRIYNDAGGDNSTIGQRRQSFQNTLNAEILLENCDGTEIQAARFNPRNSGDGTIIWYGSGVYDWYAPGGSNQNVKKLTENTLLYLAGGEAMLSVQDSNGKININIYPNPVSNILNIKTEGIASSEIYDMNGRKVLTSESKIISVDKLTPGNYSVKVKVGNAFKTFKFIKK